MESTLVDARSVRVKLQRTKNRVRNSCREVSGAPKVATGVPLIVLRVSLIEIPRNWGRPEHRRIRHRGIEVCQR